MEFWKTKQILSGHTYWWVDTTVCVLYTKYRPISHLYISHFIFVWGTKSQWHFVLRHNWLNGTFKERWRATSVIQREKKAYLVSHCRAARKNPRHLLHLTVMMLTLSVPSGTAPTRASLLGGLAGHLARSPKPSTVFTSISLCSMCGLCKALSPPLHNEPQSCWKLTRQSENTQPWSPAFNKALTGLTQGVLAQQCSLTAAAAYALRWMGCPYLGWIPQLIIGFHFMQVKLFTDF